MSIISYNICGLKSKIENVDFLNSLRTYDIFILLETFVEEKKFDFYEKFFSNYNLLWVSATRSSKFGRPMGGRVYGIKNSSFPNTLINYCKLDGVDLIRIKNTNFEIFLLPVYLNAWEEDFSG